MATYTLGVCDRCGEETSIREYPTAPEWADNRMLCDPCADHDPKAAA